MSRSFSRFRAEAFLAGLSLGVVGSYLLYMLYRSTRKGPSLLTTLWSLIRTDPPEVEIDVDEAVQFYYAEPELNLPSSEEQGRSPGFAARCALLCEQHTEILKDFTGEFDETTCLDVGCSVGATTFELSRSFHHVMGIDPSKELIEKAECMKNRRRLEYTTVIEGDVKEVDSVKLDEEVEVEGIQFKVEDPCSVSDYNAVDCILSALLLCRLHHPKKFLDAVPRLLKRNGTCILVTCYDQDTDIASIKQVSKGYQASLSEEGLKEWMNGLGMELIHEENLPFMRKRSSRKFEWNIAHATVWKHRIQSSIE